MQTAHFFKNSLQNLKEAAEGWGRHAARGCHTHLHLPSESEVALVVRPRQHHRSHFICTDLVVSALYPCRHPPSQARGHHTRWRLDPHTSALLLLLLLPQADFSSTSVVRLSRCCRPVTSSSTVGAVREADDNAGEPNKRSIAR